MLRVPAYWMVHSELLVGGGGEEGGGGREGDEEACVTLVLRSPAARTRRERGSLLLQAARQAELELSHVFTPQRAPQAMRDLLRVIKRGEMVENIFSSSSSSSSLAASASAAGASAAREALAAALADLRVACLGSSRVLLGALEAAADPRRFTKARWLEADGRAGRFSPPALSWVAATAQMKTAEDGGESNGPRLFVDSRTAEEKYPSLFRATIEAKARERVPWVPKKKKEKQLLLKGKQKKEKKEKGEALLLLLPAAAETSE